MAEAPPTVGQSDAGAIDWSRRCARTRSRPRGRRADGAAPPPWSTTFSESSCPGALCELKTGHAPPGGPEWSTSHECHVASLGVTPVRTWRPTSPTSSPATTTTSTPGTTTFENPYDDIAGVDAGRNWDSDRRLREMEADGIVAEVLFPNTIPPFFPKTSFVHQPPGGVGTGDLERRWAGLRGEQPVARRLLRGDTRPARRNRADHAARRRGVGRGDPLGRGPRPHRRRAPTRRAAGLGRTAALRARLRADLARVRGARASGEPPQRQRGAGHGRLPGGPGGVPARGHLVGAPHAVAPALRRRAWNATPTCSSSSRSRARRGCRRSSTRLDYYFGRLAGAGGAAGSQEAIFGESLGAPRSRRRESGRASATLGSSFIRTHEVDRARACRGRPHHVGQRLPPPRGLLAVLAGSTCASPSPGFPSPRCARWSVRNAAASTASTSTPSRRSPPRFGPSPAEVAEPLTATEIPDDSLRCPAFAAARIAVSARRWSGSTVGSRWSPVEAAGSDSALGTRFAQRRHEGGARRPRRGEPLAAAVAALREGGARRHRRGDRRLRPRVGRALRRPRLRGVRRGPRAVQQRRRRGGCRGQGLGPHRQRLGLGARR